MYPRLIGVALVLAATLGCSGATRLGKADVNLLCDVATGVDKEGSVKQKKLVVEIGKQLAGKHAAPGLKAAWTAVEKAPPKLRRAAYNEILDEAGVPNFKCAPLEKALKIK